MTLAVVLYGCEIYLTIKEERWLKVLEIRIMNRISGSKKDATGEWRRLHNENLQSSEIK